MPMPEGNPSYWREVQLRRQSSNRRKPDGCLHIVEAKNLRRGVHIAQWHRKHTARDAAASLLNYTGVRRTGTTQALDLERYVLFLGSRTETPRRLRIGFRSLPRASPVAGLFTPLKPAL